MKILQISSAQTLGGGERHLADLANGLARRGHSVYAALRPEAALRNELGDLATNNFATLPLRNSLDIRSAAELAKLVRKNQIEIVHAHLARDYPLAAYATRMNPGARLIVTRHVLFRMTRLHRVTLVGAARVIAVSQAVASRLLADGIVAPERISVVLNGIDTARFARARAGFKRAEFLERWSLPPQGILVGTVGELTPLKGHEDLLRAAAQVLNQYPMAHFIIAGLDHSRGQEHRRRIEQLIRELNLTKQVRLIGWVVDLAELYCGLDVFVSPSHTESFGLVVAEAMASGAAVVATRNEGAQELIRDGETGLLVPIGDADRLAEAILDLLRKTERRINFGIAAQQMALANFSVERMIDETAEIYRAETEYDS